MAVISGNDGAISFGGSDYPITEWSIEETGEVSDTTDSSSTTYKDFVAVGFLNWKGKCKAWLKSAATQPAFHSSVAVVLTAKSGTTWTGNCIITNRSFNLKIDSTDAVTIDLSFQGVGVLTPANA